MFVDDSEHHITIAHGIGDYPIGEKIHNIADLSGFISFLKFFENPIRAFDSSFNLEVFYTLFFKEISQYLDASLCIFFSFTKIFF